MSTTIYVNSTWKSGEKVTIDGVEYTVGTDAFTSYDGALNYAKNNSTARNATIVMMKNSSVSGNCIDHSTHKNYYNLKVTIQDGAVMGNANSKWDMTYAFTVEAGGVLQSARPVSAGYGYTHVKNVMTIGEADAEKQAVVNFINSPTIPYKTMCISVLYNGSLNVTNAIVKVGDLGMIGKSEFTDSTIEVAGSIGFAAGTQTCAGKHSMTNSTMTVKGHDLRGDSTYSAADCNRIANLIMDNSTIIIDDGVENTAADVVELGVLKSGFLNNKKELIMQNNSKITVEAGTQINLLYNVSMSDSVIEGGNFSIVSGDLTMTGKSNLDIAVLDIAAEKKIVIDNTASIVADALTGTGTIEINVVDAVAGLDKVIDLADGADTTGLIDRISVKQDGYSAIVKDGDVYVAAYLYVESGVVSDITAALSSAEGRVVQISGRYVDVDQATMDAIANGDVKFAAGTMFFLAEGVTTAYSDANLTVKEFGVKADLVDGVVDLAADNAVATGNIGSNDADLTLTTGDAAEGSAEVRADVTGSNVVLENSKELAITGSVSGSNVEINNADDAVLDGGSDDYSAKISADEKITFVNDGHAVVDMSAKTIEIENNSVNTITGSKLEGETVIIDAKENADGVVSETEIIATNVEIADQTVSDSKITGRVQITADTSLIDTEATGVVSVGYDKENVADTTLTLGGETTIDLLYVGNEGRENNYKLEVAGADANVTLGQLYNRTDSDTVISDEAKLNISGYWQSKGNVVVDNATVNHNGFNMYVYNNDSTSVSKITLKNGAVLNSNNSVGIVLGNKNDSPAAAIGNAELVLEGKSTLNVTNLTLQAEGEVEEVAGEKAATSMTVNDSEVNVANTLTNNSVINIVMGAEDLSDGVDDVNINAKAIKGSGTIIIDATKFAGGVDKVINVSEAGDVTVVFKEGTAAEGVKMLVNEEGDVFVSDVKAETLYVDANFKGEFGDMVGEGMYLGINAFANFEEALIAAQDNTSVSRVELLSDCLIESVINPGEAYDFKQQIAFGSAEGESFKVEFSASLANGSKFSIYTMSGDTSVTFEENFEIAGMDILANGFATNNNEMIIDGTVKALSLKQWTSNNEIVVNKTGKVVLGYGDGVLDMAYGNGSVVVNGTLKDTKDESLTDGPQFKAGYVQIRGNGNTLELNNTYFEGGSWFTDYNGAGSNFTVNVSNSVLKVSGGDAAGVFTLSDGKNHTVNLKDGSRFIVANVNLGTSNVINVADSSMEISKTLANNGTVNVSGTSSLKLGTVSGDGVIDIAAGTTLVDTVITSGNIKRNAGTVYFEGANKLTGNFSNNPDDWDIVINKGASLEIARGSYVLGYDRDITINGLIEDATSLTAEDLANTILSFKTDSPSGFSVGGTGTNVVTVNDAYVDFANTSWKNSYATHTWSFTNSYVTAVSFGNNNAGASDTASWTVTFDDSVLAANYIKTGKGMIYNFTNGSQATAGSMRIEGVLNVTSGSKVSITAYQNNKNDAADEHGDITGTVVVDNATLDINGAKTQEVELFSGAELTVKNNGKLNLNGRALDVMKGAEFNVENTTFEAVEVNNAGAFNVTGESTLNIDTLTGNAIDLAGTLVDSTVGGGVTGSAEAGFAGENKVDSALFYEGADITVKEGADVDVAGTFATYDGGTVKVEKGAEVAASSTYFNGGSIEVSGKLSSIVGDDGGFILNGADDTVTINEGGVLDVAYVDIYKTTGNSTVEVYGDAKTSFKLSDGNKGGKFTWNIYDGGSLTAEKYGIVMNNAESAINIYGDVTAAQVSNAGSINVNGGTVDADNVTNSGTINVNGGTVDVDIFSGAGTFNVGAAFDKDGNAVASELNIGELNSAVTVNDNSDKQAVLTGSIDKLTSQITTKGEAKFSGMNINADAESAAGTGTLRTEAKVIIADNSEINLAEFNVRNGGSIELGSVVDTKNFVATDTIDQDPVEFNVAGTLNAANFRVQFNNTDSKVTIAAGGAYKQSAGYFWLDAGNFVIQGSAEAIWTGVTRISNGSYNSTLTVDGTYAAENNDNGKFIGTTLSINSKGELNVINGGLFSLTGNLNNSLGTINVSGSTLNANYISSSGTITVDDKSTITAAAGFSNQGTITINVSDSFSGTKTIIDVDNVPTADYGTVNVVGGKDVIHTTNAEGDLVIYKVDTNTLFVNSEWASVADDTEIATNLVKGVNAFANTTDALTKANSIAADEEGKKFVIINVDNMGDASQKPEFSLTSAGEYVVTGGNGSIFTPILVTGKDVKLKFDGAFVTLGKLRGGKDDAGAYQKNSIEIVDSVIAATDYQGAGGGWATFYDCSVTISNSIYGINLKDSVNELELPRSAEEIKGAIAKGEYTMVSRAGYSGQHIGTVGSLDIDDSTVFTGFFSVSDRGLTNIDNSMIYIGMGLHVGWNSWNGNTGWGSSSAEDHRVGEAATVNITDSIVKNIYWGDGGSDNGVHVGGTTAGVLNITNSEFDMLNDRNTSVTIEADGTINMTDSVFKAGSVTNKGTFTVGGESTLNIDSYNNGKFVWGKAIQLLDGAIIKDSNVGGYVDAVGKVTFRGDNTFGTIQDFEASYHDNNTAVNNTEMIIEKGASVTTESAKFNLGFGDKLSVYGNLEDAKAAYEAGTLTADDYSLDAQKGMFFQGNRAEDVTTFNVNDAYVRLGANEQSVANAEDENQRLGTYNFNWTNAVVEAEETFDFKDSGEYNGNYNFNLDNTVLKVGAVETDKSYPDAENNPAYRGAINFADKDSTFKAKDSNVVVIGKESNNYNAGTFEFDNSELNLNAAFVNDGSATFDGENAGLDATNVINRGTITLANGAELNAGSYSTVSAKVAFYDGSDEPENITFVAYDEAGNEIGRTTAFINGIAKDKIEDAIEVAVVKGDSYKAFKADGTQINDATFEIVADSSDADLVINGNSKVDVDTLYNGGTISVQNGTLDVTQLINSSNNFHINGGSTVTVDKLVNNAKLFISGENTIKVEDATGSGYAIRVNDGAIFNDSYIKAGNNATTRLLGSATFNGGFSAAYFATKPGEVSEEAAAGEYTITIEDDTAINASYGFEFNGNYTISGGKLVLSGGNANGKVWGFVFQNGNFDINSDIEVDGNGVTAPIHFTNATATVRSDISHANSGGEPIYIKNSNVTMTAGSTWTAKTGVHINANSTLTINDGSIYGNVSANEDSSKLILSEKALIQGNINNNGTIIINVDDTNRNAVATLINANKGANFGNIVIDEADAAAGVDYKIDEESGDLVVYNKNFVTTIYVNADCAEYSIGYDLGDGKYFGINAFADTINIAADSKVTNLVIAAGSYSNFNIDKDIVIKTEGDVILNKVISTGVLTVQTGSSLILDSDTNPNVWLDGSAAGLIVEKDATVKVNGLWHSQSTAGRSEIAGTVELFAGSDAWLRNVTITETGKFNLYSQLCVYVNDETGFVVNGAMTIKNDNAMGENLLIGNTNEGASKFTVSGENASVKVVEGSVGKGNVTIEDNGFVTVEKGAEFISDGKFTSAGSVLIDGADFSAGKLTNNGTFTATKDVNLNIGELAGRITVEDATLLDGTVIGDAANIAGCVDIIGEEVNFDGEVVINSAVNANIKDADGNIVNTTININKDADVTFNTKQFDDGTYSGGFNTNAGDKVNVAGKLTITGANVYLKAETLVAKDGEFIVNDAGFQNTYGKLTVKGDMTIIDTFKDGAYQNIKLAGNDNASTTGELDVDGGTLTIDGPSFAFGGGYNSKDWVDVTKSSVLVQNGGKITANSIIFRNGVSNTLTLNNGTFEFTEAPDFTNGGTNTVNETLGLTVDNKGVINASNNSTVDFGDRELINDGSMTIDNSTFEAGSLVNNGSFALSGVVTVNAKVSGEALNVAYAATLKDSKLSADLKLNAYALIENSTLSGNLSGTANITIVGKDNIFSGSFDKNIAIYGDYYNSTLTVNADAFNGNFVNNVFLNITGADFSNAISVNTNLGFIKSINGFEIENGIAGDYIFVDDKGTTDDTSDDVTYKLVQSGASISFKELEDTNGKTVYESSYLVVTNNVSMPDATVQMGEGNTTAYVGYGNTVEIGALTKHENGGVNYLTVDALAGMKVNGKVDSVNYLGLGYQAKISAEDVTGTVYNDSVVVGQEASAEFKSLDFKGGYDSMYVGYKAEAKVTGDVEDLYSLTVDYMGKMTIGGDFAAPEFTNIINVGGEASLTVTGIIENEDVNAGTIMYVGWNSQVAVNGKNSDDVSIAGLEYLSVGGGDLVNVKEHFKVAGDITGTANNNVYYFGYQAVASMGNIDTKGGYDQIITADRSNVTIGNINQVDYISVGAFAEFEAKEVNATKLYNSAFVANYESVVSVSSIDFASGYNQLLAYGKEFTVVGDVKGVSYLYAGNKFTAGAITGSAYNDTIVVAYNSTFDVVSVDFGTAGYNQFITYSAVATGDVSGVSYLYAGADFTADAITGTEYNDSIVAVGEFEATSIDFGAGYNQITAYGDFKVTNAVNKVSYIYNAKNFTAGAITGTEYNDSIVAVGEFEAASVDFGAGYNQITAYNKFSVNGDVNNVSYIYNAGDFTATGAVSGTEYNDSIVAVGKFEAASIDFDKGYNSITAYDDFKVTNEIENVSYIYAGKDFTAGAVTGTEYNDSLVSGYDADMTLGDVKLGAGNDVVNLGVLSNTTFGGLNGGEGYDALYLGHGANLVINGSIENFEAVVGSYTNNIILTGTMNSEAKAMADAYGINVFENAELFTGAVTDATETLDDVNGYDIFNLSADSKWNCDIQSGEVKVYAFNQSSCTWESISAISSTHPEEFEIVNSGKYSMVRVELDKDKATSVTYDVTLA